MVILSIYTTKIFKEKRLPVLNNADFSILLSKEEFGLINDVRLELENVNGEWYVENSDYLRIIKNSEPYDGSAICNNDIYKVATSYGDTFIVIAKNVEFPVAVFDKFNIAGLQDVTIGKRQDMDICYDYQSLVSREHTIMYRSTEGWVIRNNSANGIYVNSMLVDGEKLLQFGDHISIVGLHLVFLGEILAVNLADNNVVINYNKLVPYYMPELTGYDNSGAIYRDSRELLFRAPRNIEKIYKEPITIEAVPDKKVEKKQSLLQIIGSSLTMSLPMLICGILMIYGNKSSGTDGGITMYTGIIMAASSALLSVMWTIVNMATQKKEERREELKRFDAYAKYLVDVAENIRDKYNANVESLNRMYKHPNQCIDTDVSSGLLWNRNIHHDDYLHFRLGIGNLPFSAPIIVPQSKFSLDEDSLKNKPALIKKNFQTMFNVPVGVDLLANKLVGLVGGEDRTGAIQVIKSLVTQIATNNCYTDVKLVFVYDKDASYNNNVWEFAKWLPHVWSEDKKVRYVASDKQEASDIFYELTKVFRQRDEQEQREGVIPSPYYIMFLINPELIEGELISKYIFSNDEKYGISTVFVSNTYTNLPNLCEFVIENDDIYQGKYNVKEEKDEKVEIIFDDVDSVMLEQYARKLSNIYVQETEGGGDIPSSLTFFEMYKVTGLEQLDVIDRWRKNRTYDNIKGLVGEKSGGVSCYLDVHEKYHGPHGLVAGTTGSGKSETLQTYMLSLAVNYSPDDIGFFVIDYKGGGMANLFNGLPHLIASISNLSGNQVRRAMASIKSENRRRQRIFNENGVNNINLYTKLYKNNEATVPIPHLFIIIDEFAELKREEPDFMSELISVAQVGRSLGVHLILATQKPNGTVDDNIWSNTKFRLCLRVADKQDSNDMLHKPDAAFLTQAGRCYLQVGSDEVFDLFQSGFSGAAYNENESTLDIATLVSLTGKVDMKGNYAKTSQKTQGLHRWIRILTDTANASMEMLGISLEQCLEYNSRMQQVIEGMYSIFENSNIEYPRSTYNTARLEDLIRIYHIALNARGDLAKSIATIAEKDGVKLPLEKERTQLDAVKDYLAAVARDNGYDYQHQLWMPVLPSNLYLDEFVDFNNARYVNQTWPALSNEWDIDVVIGKYDDPQNQAQEPLHFNISEGGHHAICGMVVSGKSTSLQTIMYALINKYTPDYINIYGIDFSSKMMSAFENAPHVGGIMYEGENERIAKFFNMLRSILAERKKLFRGGNYSQYIQVNGLCLPAILIFVDNFGAFNEKTEEKYISDMITIAKEGQSHGIYLVVTGGGFSPSEIPNKVAENIKSVISTEMPDKYSYSDVLRSFNIDVLPEAGIKGRGLAAYGARFLEYQTALAINADDDYTRLETISIMCEEMASVWNGKKARPIPEIPEKPVWSEFSQLDEFKELVADKNFLPVGYNGENASVYGINLSQVYTYMISGFGRSGKKNFLRVLIQSALCKDSQVCVIDGPGKEMVAYSSDERVTYAEDAKGIYEFFSSIIPEFKRRNKLKRELLAQDLEEEEIYEQMSQEKPIFIFITDLVYYFKEVYDGGYEMSGFLENISEKGRLHNIYFFGVAGVGTTSEIEYMKAYKFFAEPKMGIHFGGNVGSCRVFNFDFVPYKQQSKVLKPGIGLTASKLEASTTKVVIPLARR